MGEEINADLERMRWLVGRLEEAAETLYGGRSSDAPDWVFQGWPVPESAFGNVAGAQECHEAWTKAQDEAGGSSKNLWKVINSDVARLAQVVTAFQQTDDEVADRICAQGKTITFLSAHTHSGSGLEDDYVRGDQNYRLVDIASDILTPGFVGADLNEQLGDDFGDLHGDRADGLSDPRRREDNYSSQAIGNFDEHGYADVGPAGPTSNEGEGQRIDHMRSRGLVVEDARVVDGGPSDHQAQAAEVTTPWW
jgi:hypothetical protein